MLGTRERVLGPTRDGHQHRRRDDGRGGCSPHAVLSLAAPRRGGRPTGYVLTTLFLLRWLCEMPLLLLTVVTCTIHFRPLARAAATMRVAIMGRAVARALRAGATAATAHCRRIRSQSREFVLSGALPARERQAKVHVRYGQRRHDG